MKIIRILETSGSGNESILSYVDAEIPNPARKQKILRRFVKSAPFPDGLLSFEATVSLVSTSACAIELTQRAACSSRN